ncbi:MAG: PspC domain-containing protein [Lutibacter sp.]|uniref:PspC domain-containing protein n=1 Tax=Lutibacter sp. TaxID=1925666 RepID=UPI0017C071DB|nr:PspC domain-containing protein [Lutibacter sp.]MBT8316295.1 PspC domain-containing protein [Lutibacter sp.]NNJ57155.1 PspC domain-containing protein [Lutibacter sp.]
MNKTININLGGIFFHIDEIAYQKLKLYLDAIRRSLSDDPQGRDEILNDIEHRIGELLSERVKDERQVVNENDIDEITKIMGKPEDYLVDEEIFEDEPSYRPKSSSKKLFRDGEDKFLGGVSSGLAHYLGIDSLWVRLIWIVLVVAGFGTGIPIYILLWILIPEATTTAEKLQMKGEPVNISNIEKKIREEFQDVSSRVKDGVNDVTSKVRNTEFQNKAKSGLQDVIETLTKIFLAIFNVFGKFIGALLILVASLTLIGLIIGAFSWGGIEILGFGEEFVTYPPFVFDSIMPSWLIIIFGFIAIGIPFVVLFMLGLKIISSNVKSFSTTTKLSLLGIWIISLLGLGLAIADFATRTAYDGVHNQTEELPLIASDTLKVKMIGNDNLSTYKELRRRYNSETVIDNDIQKLYSTRINVDVKPTDNTIGYVKIRKESEGKSRLSANNDAESIEYQFNLNDKNLELNGYFLSDFKHKFKDQLIDVTIYLPVYSLIYLDNSTRTFLDDVDNIQEIRDRDMPKHYYKMTENGLECLDCDPDIFGDSFKRDNEHFNLNIDRNGLEIKVKDNDGGDAEIKLDENGLIIK